MIVSRWKVAVCLVALLSLTLFGGTFATGLSGVALGSTVFFEDFNDGSATDGSPVTWRPYSELGLTNGSFSASTGDYVLTPYSGADVLSAILDPAVNLTNVSIRTQLRNTGTDDATLQGTGFLVRADFATPSQASFDCGIENDGVMYIGDSRGGFTELAAAQTALRPLEEDVVLQLDVVGDSLRLFAWRPGESKPQQPQVQATSSYRTSGSIGIYYNPPASNGSAIFRYIHVAEMSIPEPSSFALGSLGAIALTSLALSQRPRRVGSVR